MLAIVVFALFATFCEITMFNVPRWSRFESLTFKKSVKVISYNVVEYVVGLLFVAYKILLKVHLSQSIFHWSTSEACTRTHTFGDGHTHSDDSNRRECNALHFA